MKRPKPYPSYKDSGVPWLGKVPEHWEVHSLGSMTKARSHRGQPELPLLSVLREKGVVLRSSLNEEENHNYIPDDLSNYKVVRAGDLVINKMKAWQGSLGLAPVDGLVSPAYFIYDFKIDNRRFGQVLLRSRPYVWFFAQASDGVRIGQWDLAPEGMKRIPVVVPTSSEQAAIVRFLSHADQSIRRYILAKQKLIKLLGEQKHVVVQRLVTRGLNQGSRMKTLGQLGVEVPQHWKVLQVRRLVSTVTSGSRGWAAFYSDEGEVFLQSGNLGRSMSLNLARVQHVQLPSNAEGVRTKVKRNDILVCITGALTGNVIIVDTNLANAYVNQHVALVRPRHDAVDPRFLAYCLHSRIGQAQFKASEYGGTKQGLGLDEVKSALVPLPPSDEQTLIVKALDEQLAALNLSIERIHHEMELVREYRTRLIADVVTGKLDVRDAAAGLPDETEEPEELPLEDDVLEDSEASELAPEELAEEEVVS